MSWNCEWCDEQHREPDDCCGCGGDGYLEDDEGGASACGCPKGEQMAADAAREFAWMIPHIQRSQAARRRGDIEEAERIKHDVLRHDSPYDPMNRRVP